MKQRSFHIAIGCSLVIHALMVLGMALSEQLPSPVRPPKNETVVIELIEPAKDPLHFVDTQKTRQIVEQSEQAVNDEIDSKAKYLSQNNQRVVHQTVATKNGKFQNDGGKGQGQAKVTQSPTESEKPKPVTKTAPPKVKNLNQLLPGYSFKPRQQQIADVAREQQQTQNPAQQPSIAGDGRALSQTQDHLEDIDRGMETLLSTREFVYYSYYQRIRNQLSQHWESRIKAKIKRMYQTGRQIASEQNKITKVMIVLDRSGTLIGVKVMSGSGVQDLDEAAVEAFRAAAPFPNPPEGIAEDDGTIQIRWDFVLEA